MLTSPYYGRLEGAAIAATNVAATTWQAPIDLVAPAAPWLVDDPTGQLLVLTAGAVPWRYDPDGGLEVAIIKRRRQADWGFPKGSPLPGEAMHVAAQREMREETGFAARHAAPLANLVYPNRSGRPKLASYWLVRAGSGEFAPNREVIKLLWLPPRQARMAISQERERAVLDLAVEALGLGLLTG